MVVSGQFQNPVALPSGKAPSLLGTKWIGGWVGHGLDEVAKRKKLLLLTGNETRSSSPQTDH